MASISKEELPEELQNKSAAELQAFVDEKKKEREALQKEINELAMQRQAYIDEQLQKESNNTGDDLGDAINQSIHAIAQIKGYTTD